MTHYIRLLLICITLAGCAAAAAAQDQILRPQRDERDQITVSPATAALIKQAEAGDADAANTVGFQYGNGLSVMQNDAEALKWYRKAAELGSEEGMYNLAGVHENGYGVKQDYQEAVKWYRKAAERGHAGAHYALARLYEQGQGVPKDPKQSAEWRRKGEMLEINPSGK
ncbi:MAG TPA: tetratricopeptide repeat protein [Gammaproteobacteria bacterium]|nr:tetratricopeptide repeat protein [Gammaproteobacteria bacterium]